MGGVGKTSVALKVAADLTSDFPGGIFWGALPDYGGKPQPILYLWGRACGHNFSDEPDISILADLIRGILSARIEKYGPILIIIDDIRPDWLDSGKLLKFALPAGVPLLFTTRDEVVAKAIGASTYHLSELSPDEALNLLKAHAGTRIIEQDLRAANRLSELVGYLPLAVELAGKHLALKVDKPGYHLAIFNEAVAKQATEALALPGHPGLAAIFAISYTSLPNEIQQLFRWLGVFADPLIPLDGVAKVMGISEVDTESLLDALVPSALLNWGESGQIYKLHPLLHQYAKTLLTDCGEENEARRRHLEYCVALVPVYFKESLGEQGQSIAVPNMLAALEYASVTMEVDDAELLTTAQQYEEFREHCSITTAKVKNDLLNYFRSRGMDLAGDISVSIKLMISSADIVNLIGDALTQSQKEMMLGDKWVITFVRDPDTIMNRPDREVGGRIYDIKHNTSYHSIITDQRPYFLDNDLRRGSAYLNENPEWSRFYNSTLGRFLFRTRT